MTPAEFFILAYDFRRLQKEVTEDYKNKDTGSDAKERRERLEQLAVAFDNEVFRCDNKSQKTYYLLAKEKLQRTQAMAKLKTELDLKEVKE